MTLSRLPARLGALILPLALGAAAAMAAAQTKPVDRVVAVVNSEAITELDLQARVRLYGRRLTQQGAVLPPGPEFERQVLERMIADRAQMQAARDAGVRIDDAQIDRAVARIAQDRKIGVAEMRRQLEAQGTPFSVFRDEVAQEIVIGQVRQRDIEGRVTVSEAEIDAFLAEQAAGGGQAAQYNIAQVMVAVPEGASPDEVQRARERAEAIERELRAGADMSRWARATPDADGVAGGMMGMRPADRLPELFVAAVEKLQPGEFSPVLRSPAGFHVLRLLERGGSAALLPSAPVRQTRARHILVRVNELNPEGEVIRRLTEIRERIEQGGATFEDMARQYSMDGSAQQGGDLGWVYAGDTVPEFERAMDALAPGAIAGPVQTPFGFHLIQVVERRTDEASPTRVRAAARAVLRERRAQEAYREWLAQVRDRAYVEYRLDER